MTDATLTTAAPSRLPELIGLAETSSSEARRALLRELTDRFFGEPDRSATEQALYDDVLSSLAAEMETAVRAELGRRFAQSPDAPRRLIRSLAADASQDVALPVLTSSPVLSQDDLAAVAEVRGQAHLHAITQRNDVSEALSEIIVRRGDDSVLGALLANETARLSRPAAHAAVDRARANPDLHRVIVERRNLPPDLLNEMYFVVESRLRRVIVERNANLPTEMVDQALAAVHDQLAVDDGVYPPDYPDARAEVAALSARGPLSTEALVRLLRRPSRTAFLVALSDLADIDVRLAGQIVERREIDALSVLCKACELDRALFLTLVMAVLGNDDNAVGRAREYGRLYTELTRDQALRTVRFWRLRRHQQAA